MTRTTLPTPALVVDPGFAALREHVIAATGLAYYRDREADLAEHVGVRLSRLGIGDAGEYLRLLRSEPEGEAELEALAESLTIGETFFFRHEEMFDALRDRVLPDVIRRRRGARPLRIWSAGCSIGAEPYSVAMLLRRELRGLTEGLSIDILGTDINRAFLARAREGLFEEWTLRGMPEHVREECFAREGRSWRIAPEYRACVRFQYHNLVRHPIPSLVNNLVAFDVILCRNVMIYLSLEETRRLASRFHAALVNGGWLLVGHAEPNTEVFRAFHTINVRGAVLYQREDAPSSRGGSPPCAPGIARPPAPRPPVPPIPIRATPLDRTLDARRPDPPEPDARASVREAADRGDLAEAAARCRRHVERDGLDPVLHYYLGVLLGQVGEHEESERSLKRAIYIDRACVLAHYHLGLVHQARGRAARAAQSFRNVLDLLAQRDGSDVIPDADGMTVASLAAITREHLAVQEGA